MIDMPAVSQAQQRFFGMVRAAQKGELKNPSTKVRDAAKNMSASDVKDFASTSHDDLPKKASTFTTLTPEEHLEAYKTAAAVLDIVVDGGVVDLGNVKLSMVDDNLMVEMEDGAKKKLRVHPDDQALLGV